jgi:hypothetical protein
MDVSRPTTAESKGGEDYLSIYEQGTLYSHGKYIGAGVIIKHTEQMRDR